MLPTHLHVYCVYTVFLHRTLCLNGWERVKSKSQIFSKRLVRNLRPFQGVCDGVENVLILAATNTPYALD